MAPSPVHTAQRRALAGTGHLYAAVASRGRLGLNPRPARLTLRTCEAELWVRVGDRREAGTAWPVVRCMQQRGPEGARHQPPGVVPGGAGSLGRPGLTHPPLMGTSGETK